MKNYGVFEQKKDFITKIGEGINWINGRPGIVRNPMLFLTFLLITIAGATYFGYLVLTETFSGGDIGIQSRRNLFGRNS